MRIPACLLVLCIAGPTLGKEKLTFDFRGARFSSECLRYEGPTPDKYMKPEPEGLRLRYTGADVPGTSTPAGVAWRYHVRGNFVVTAQYEILKCEPPAKGTFYTGAELYVRLDNVNRDAVTVARGVFPDGSAATAFKVLTKGAAGKRITTDFKRLDTTEKSLRGRLRLARKGPIVTGSFAAGDDSEFTEVQQAEIGTADIRLVRMAATAGGDSRAVLDMRIVEFQLEGEALALDGQFVPPAPKADIPKAKADAPHEFVRPTTEQMPAGKQNLLLLAVVLSAFVLAVLAVAGSVLRSRRRKAAIGIGDKAAGPKRGGNEDR